MPEVSRFYGIVVRFYYRDHPPGHFHVFYGEYEALIEIETGAVYQGRLPKTAYDLVNACRCSICRNCGMIGIVRGSSFRCCPFRRSTDIFRAA